MVWGERLVKHGSAVQSTIALSSGESEYYAMFRVVSHSLGLRSMLGDWGLDVGLEIVIRSDSS
eukprot:2108868-Lingulodinium_polyedra.AAC.1